MRLLPLLLAAAALLTGAASGAATDAGRAARVRDELPLAASKEIYLAFAPATGELQLRLQGVVLRRFPATARVTLPRTRGAAWPGAVFELRDGIPPYERPVVVAPAPGDGEADGGVTPEELVSGRDRALGAMPTGYRLRFDPDLDLVVDGSAGGAALGRGPASFFRAVADGFGRLVGRPGPCTLTLHMSAADARRLALVLRPGMHLLILADQGPARG